MKNFSIVKRGYDSTEVDQYIRQLEREIEQYKSKEEAITRAVVQAELTADKILTDADMKAARMEKSAVDQLQYLRNKVLTIKRQMKTFQKDFNELIQSYLVTLQSKDILDVFDELDTIIDFLDPDHEKQKEKSLDTEEKSEETQEVRGIDNILK